MKKIKKITILSLIFACSLFLCACQKPTRIPLSVTFVDISGAMSTDHTISIKFSEEKDFEKKYVDILVKSNTDNVELTIFQEFSQDSNKVTLSLNKSTGYVSLDEYKLFNLKNEQTDSMVGYGDALATTLVINSNKDATLTFLAIIGDKQDGKFKKTGEVSKEYTLNVKKKTTKK